MRLCGKWRGNTRSNRGIYVFVIKSPQLNSLKLSSPIVINNRIHSERDQPSGSQKNIELNIIKIQKELEEITEKIE